MQRTSLYALIVIVLCSIGLVFLYLETRPKPTDQTLIMGQVKAAVDAANARSVSGLMDEISDSYKDSQDNNADTVRQTLITVFNQRDDVHFAVTEPLTIVSGSTATTDCTLVVSDPRSQTELLSRGIHIVWRREGDSGWFFNRTPTWRATTSDINLYSSDMQ